MALAPLTTTSSFLNLSISTLESASFTTWPLSMTCQVQGGGPEVALVAPRPTRPAVWLALLAMVMLNSSSLKKALVMPLAITIIPSR